MHLDLSLGKRHLALFLGSIAALVALAMTPQLLGDRVSADLHPAAEATSEPANAAPASQIQRGEASVSPSIPASTR